jgi:hypothetical protein
MKKLVLGMAAIALGSAPALAQNAYVFGYSPTGAQTLNLNGNLTIGASQTGWFDASGDHISGNTNYFTANAPGVIGPEYRSYFTFDVAPGATSAAITIGNDPSGSYTDSGNFTLTLYDVTSAINTYQGYSGATDIFDDLGTGTVYGSITLDGTASSYTINLNAAGLAALNAAGIAGEEFTIGARVTPGGGSVPEPASWALMLGGFGLVGGALRRRKMQVSFG